MTEKICTLSEVNKLINELWLQYMDMFRENKMSFSEFVLIENIFMKIQLLFKEGEEAFE